MPAALTRGRTTQKRALVVALSATSRSSTAVTSTWLMSRVSTTCFTVPMSTSLCRILVWPASTPSADEKVMVTVGPRSANVRMPTQTTTSRAAIGTSQTSAISRLRRTRAVPSPPRSLILALHDIPHQSWVERLGGENGQQHDRREGDRARFGVDPRQVAELHQRRQDREHEHVDVRPSADILDEAMEPGPRHHPLGEAAPDRQQEPGEARQLDERHRDRRQEHDQRQRPEP